MGNGFFDDRDPTVLPTGRGPTQALVGDFDGRPGLDLVTVNSGSGDLSYFTGADLTAARTISLGAASPLVAVAGDFDFDGLTDLLVADSGDGEVSLLVAGEGGPRLAELLSHPEVEHPTALALMDTGAGWRVYLTGEGEETAFLLTSFGLLVPGAGPTEATDPTRGAELLLSSFGVLVPSEAGSAERRPLVGVLVVEGPGLPTRTDVLVPPAGVDLSGADAQEPNVPSPSTAPFVVPDASRGVGGAPDEDEAEDTSPENAPGDATGEAVSPSIRLMLGTDEALRHRRRVLDEPDAPGEEVTLAERAAARDRVFREWAEEAPAVKQEATPRPAEAARPPAPPALEGEQPAQRNDDAVPVTGPTDDAQGPTLTAWLCDALKWPATWGPVALAAASMGWVGRRVVRRRARPTLPRG